MICNLDLMIGKKPTIDVNKDVLKHINQFHDTARKIIKLIIKQYKIVQIYNDPDVYDDGIGVYLIRDNLIVIYKNDNSEEFEIRFNN